MTIFTTPRAKKWTKISNTVLLMTALQVMKKFYVPLTMWKIQWIYCIDRKIHFWSWKDFWKGFNKRHFLVVFNKEDKKQTLLHLEKQIVYIVPPIFVYRFVFLIYFFFSHLPDLWFFSVILFSIWWNCNTHWSEVISCLKRVITIN